MAEIICPLADQISQPFVVPNRWEANFVQEHESHELNARNDTNTTHSDNPIPKTIKIEAIVNKYSLHQDCNFFMRKLCKASNLLSIFFPKYSSSLFRKSVHPRTDLVPRILPGADDGAESQLQIVEVQTLMWKMPSSTNRPCLFRAGSRGKLKKCIGSFSLTNLPTKASSVTTGCMPLATGN